MSAVEMEPIWEDRSIKFDVPNLQHNLRGGEKILEVMDYIEDTKGNPNDRGCLLSTNLRFIWYSLVSAKFSLSIGFATILNIQTKTVLDKARGTTLALYILTAMNKTRYELYQESVIYREMKLRSSILNSGQLKVLRDENIVNTVTGVWNLSSDQGNLGTFIFTNIRLVWYAQINESFNISLPHMQIASIKIRESKYGPALVIQTASTGGRYILGFRVDPPSRLTDIFKELSSLYTIYSENPNFGIFYDSAAISSDLQEPQNIGNEIDEFNEPEDNEINYNFSAYMADGSTEQNSNARQPFYCKDLGFAMEKLKDGYKLSDLWDIVQAN